jgi:hypothetical protein
MTLEYLVPDNPPDIRTIGETVEIFPKKISVA